MKLFYSEKNITSRELFGFGVNQHHLATNKLLSVLIEESKQHIFFNGINKDDRDGIISSSIMKLYKIALKKEYNGEQIDKVVPYFIKIINNETINYSKTEQNNNRKTLSLSELPDKALMYNDKMHEDTYELNPTAIKKALSYIDKLNDKEQQIIRMQYFEDLDQKEIGDSLNMNTNTVKATLYRAMQKLRKSFDINKTSK